MTKAEGSFDILSGDETAYEERDDGAKLTHAWGAQRFSGDITGEGSVHWLMSYGRDKTARYVGLQRITGSLDGREGSFIIAAQRGLRRQVVARDLVGRRGQRDGRARGHHGFGLVRCPGRPSRHVSAGLPTSARAAACGRPLRETTA